jgi:hypothetical protein
MISFLEASRGVHQRHVPSKHHVPVGSLNQLNFSLGALKGFSPILLRHRLPCPAIPFLLQLAFASAMTCAGALGGSGAREPGG